MARIVHQFIALATALALVVSSAGWSMASVTGSLAAPAPSMHHHAGMQKASEHAHGHARGDDHDHHGLKAAHDATCASLTLECGQSAADEASCCAMACHVAVPAGWFGGLIMRLPKREPVVTPAYVIPRSPLFPLERPPRGRLA
jgi:hypothetical protein